jgi:hypothetical protein
MAAEAGFEAHWGQETWILIHQYQIKVPAGIWEATKRVVGHRTTQAKET